MDLQTLKEAIAGLDFKNHADIRAAAALGDVLEAIVSAIPTNFTGDGAMLYKSSYGAGQFVPYEEYVKIARAFYIQVENINGVFPKVSFYDEEMFDSYLAAIADDRDVTDVSILGLYGEYTVSSGSLNTGSGILLYMASNEDGETVYGLWEISI